MSEASETAVDSAVNAAPSAAAMDSSTEPDSTAATIEQIEALPLEERAGAYHALGERLRAELEHSDPARASE